MEKRLHHQPRWYQLIKLAVTRTAASLSHGQMGFSRRIRRRVAGRQFELRLGCSAYKEETWRMWSQNCCWIHSWLLQFQCSKWIYFVCWWQIKIEFMYHAVLDLVSAAISKMTRQTKIERTNMQFVLSTAKDRLMPMTGFWRGYEWIWAHMV